MRLVGLYGVENPAGFDVRSHEIDIEAGASEHGGYQFEADVMDVAFNRGQNHLASGGFLAARQVRLQNSHGCLHGLGCHQHFGDELLAGLVTGPALMQALHQTIVHDALGFHSSGQGFLDQLDCLDFVSIENGLLDLIQLAHRAPPVLLV